MQSVHTVYAPVAKTEVGLRLRTLGKAEIKTIYVHMCMSQWSVLETRVQVFPTPEGNACHVGSVQLAVVRGFSPEKLAIFKNSVHLIHVSINMLIVAMLEVDVIKWLFYLLNKVHIFYFPKKKMSILSIVLCYPYSIAYLQHILYTVSSILHRNKCFSFEKNTC